MTVTLGHMWWGLRSKFPRVVCGLLIVPALGGAFICYSVLWAFLLIWPSVYLFAALGVILLCLLVVQLRALVSFLKRGVLDVEMAVRAIGLALALSVGVLWVWPEL